MNVKIKTILGTELPRYHTDGAGCVDLQANFYGREIVLIDTDDGYKRSRIAKSTQLLVHHGFWYKIPCGFFLEVPEGFMADIRPRSSMTASGWLINGGVIDSDYRGEMCVLLYNLSHEAKQITHGDRIAQMRLVPKISFEWEQVEELSDTARGVEGFGSTGK